MDDEFEMTPDKVREEEDEEEEEVVEEEEEDDDDEEKDEEELVDDDNKESGPVNTPEDDDQDDDDVVNEVEDEKNDNDQDNNNDGENEEKDISDVDDKVDTEDSKLRVGGKIDTPAFCLLDGFFQDPEKTEGANTPSTNDPTNNVGVPSSYQRVTLPICQLPAVLGRTHKTNDTSFVGMGKAKALSRQQCRIEYRTSPFYPYGQLQSKISEQKDDGGGENSNTPQKSKLVFVENVKYGDENEKSTETSDRKLVVKATNDHPLPTDGFFTITALGKNRIYVNGQRFEQGETAYLYSGSIVKISTFSFYFLTPSSPSKVTMEVPNHNIIPSDEAPTENKRKISILPTKASSSNESTIDHILTGQGRRSQSLQNEIDTIPTDELMKQMTRAIKNDIWDRKHQLIGSTLSYRAVVEAASDPSAQKLADQNNGELSRGEIMDWIADCPRWKKWVGQMLSKMEQKSYQASITKGLIKAKYQRTASTGRYIKWMLPASAVASSKKKKKKKSKDEEKVSSDTSKSTSKKEHSKPKSKTESDESDDGDSTSKQPKKKRKTSDDDLGSDVGSDKPIDDSNENDDDDDSDDDNDDDNDNANNDDDDDDDDSKPEGSNVNVDDDDDDNDDEEDNDDDDDDGDEEKSDKMNVDNDDEEEEEDDDDDDDNESKSETSSLVGSNQISSVPSPKMSRGSDEEEDDEDDDDNSE